MGYLSDTLREMGFIPTGEESPIDESAILWTNGKELICDETGTVIDGDHRVPDEDDREMCGGRVIHRYQNSNEVKLMGGYIGAYDWGHDGDDFNY